MIARIVAASRRTSTPVKDTLNYVPTKLPRIIPENNATYYGFYLVKEITKDRAFVIRLGFKVKPSHQGQDEPRKGLTFKLNPWKQI